MCDVFTFCRTCVNDNLQVEIFDYSTESTVFTGTVAEARMSVYNCYGIHAFNVENGKIFLGISVKGY